MFDALKERYQANAPGPDGLRIVTSVQGGVYDAGEDGRFMPPRGSVPACILVRRQRADRAPTLPLGELLAFAPELGHWRSWHEGTCPEDLPGTPPEWKGLALELRLARADEERRAWIHAAAFLAEVGFSEPDALQAARRHALGVYAEMLDVTITE